MYIILEFEEKLMAIGYEKHRLTYVDGVYYSKDEGDITISMHKCKCSILKITYVKVRINSDSKIMQEASKYLPEDATFERVMEVVEKLKSL